MTDSPTEYGRRGGGRADNVSIVGVGFFFSPAFYVAVAILAGFLEL